MSYFLSLVILIVNFTFCISIINGQSVDLEMHLVENKNIPFWIASNNQDIYSNGSITSFKISEKLKNLSSGAEIVYKQTPAKAPLLQQAYFRYKKNKLFLFMGMKNSPQKFSNHSVGSFVESSNAKPIPKILFGIKDYSSLFLSKNNVHFSFKIAHGWINSSEYLKNPYIHEKSININKKFSSNSSIALEFEHISIWGGETMFHGKQPTGLNNFLRIFFALPGGEESIKEEQKNALGNHLGAWNIIYEKNFKNKIINFYIQHPYEDESGARWIINEFDGLYGIKITQKESSYISSFTYEHINSMDQSGSEGASDSTYGWDNYYNHYIYQSGWTNNGRVIGNPLFTLGSNLGRYSNGEYIINNRLKAHHFGFLGSISDKINYKILFTYSKNFGTYPDEDFFKSKNKPYRFDGGLIQKSGLIELNSKNLFDKIDVSIAFGFDNGELLNKTDSFMLKINHKFVF